MLQIVHNTFWCWSGYCTTSQNIAHKVFIFDLELRISRHCCKFYNVWICELIQNENTRIFVSNCRNSVWKHVFHKKTCNNHCMTLMSHNAWMMYSKYKLAWCMAHKTADFQVALIVIRRQIRALIWFPIIQVWISD